MHKNSVAPKNTSGNLTEADYKLYITAVNEKLAGNLEKAHQLFLSFAQKNPKSADVYYNLADIASNQQNFSKALEYATQAVQLNSTNKWYLKQKALLCEMLNKNAEAIVLYNKLETIEPKEVDIYIERAKLYTKLNQPENALYVMDKYTKKYGFSYDIEYEKYNIYLQQQKYTQAISLLNGLIGKRPQEIQWYLMAGELYEQNNQPDEAVKLYLQALQVDSESGQANLQLAKYYFREQKVTEGFEYLKKAFSDKNFSIDEKTKIALDFYERSKSNTLVKKQGFELIDILQTSHPNSAIAFSIAGDYYKLHGDIKTAREKFIQSVAIDPNKYVLWRQIILMDLQLNYMDELEQHAKKANELFSTQPEFYLYYGIALNKQKKYAEAIDIFSAGKELIIADDELLTEFYISLGEAMHYTNQFQDSDNYFEQALTLKPNYDLALNSYAYILALRKQKLTLAKSFSEKALSISPKNPSFLDTYGFILFQLENYVEAEKQLLKAIENGGENNAVILEHYADALYKNGNIIKAEQYWIKAKNAGGNSVRLEQKITQKKFIE